MHVSAFYYISITLRSRVARWFLFEPNIQIWGNFGGLWNKQCLYIYLFCGHSEYFTTIWYTLREFGQFSTVLVCCTKKNLATLQLRSPAESARCLCGRGQCYEFRLWPFFSTFLQIIAILLKKQCYD
jgi:hypothetical protein